MNNQYFSQETFFNEEVKFYKNIESYENINTNKVIASAVPGFEGISAGLLASSKNRIYVSTAGDDTNSGLSADDPVRTVSKAAEIARNEFTPTERKSIYISSGDYTENIPIIIPTFCAIIGDSLRTVILRPGVPDVDFFKVREGAMLMNLVFRDNEQGDFTFRYAISYDTSNGKLIINQSPYALNCSLISTRGRGKNAYSIVAGQWAKGSSQTPRGCFAYVDGDAVDSISSGDPAGGNLESMVFALLSIITPGIGIHIDNCAYSQIVNVFGIFNTDNILCENGGYASITNSATNFGINALRAVGFSTVSKTYSQDVGIVTFSCASSVGIGSTDRIVIAGAASTIPASQSIVSIVDNGTGDPLIAPSINNLIRIGYNDGETPFVHVGTEFQIRKVSDAKTVSYGGSFRTAYDVAVSPRLDQFFSSPYTSYSTFIDKSIRQLRPSVVNSSSHTWEYAGSGTDYSALPKNGGKTRSVNEQVEENYGQVYTSGTNELGDFKVGNFVVLKNQTGEVQFTTPIPVAQIDRITFTSGNTNLIITGVVNDTQMGGASPSDNFLPTQRAVNVFVSSGTTSITNKTITLGGNTISGTTAQFNTALTDNDFATLAGSEILTNKTINASNNTLSNIPNSSLTNSTISGISLGSNLATLTLNTSGTGLSGSTTYNGSGNSTFTVTSNATSTNTGSTIVARDASGNFSAGTITATTFSGSGALLTSIPNSATTATSSNTASSIIVRDASGGFVAGIITATGLKLSGAIYDKDNSTGSGGQILSSTGSNTIQWINASSAAVGSATSVSITSENTNATRYINFVSSTSGIDNIRVDADLTYNPSTNVLTVGIITATSLVKSGGTSSQFLKADGSVDSNTYITSSSIGNGTLTLAVSGTGLSGSASFTANQSGNSTFTVTSNATSSNTASAIVARDASGDFSAGTITATSFVKSGGTSSQFLKADGSVDSTAYATQAFPSGTVLLFYQAAAPTGWTQVTTQNNKALRVVSGTGGGTGGSTAFTSVFTSRTPAGSVSVSGSNSGGSVSAFTLTTNEIPSHTHPQSIANPFVGSPTVNGPTPGSNSGSTTTGSTGGGGSHSHGFTNPTWSGSASFTGTAMDFAVQYIDVILCSKN